TRVQLKWFGGATHHNEVTSRKALVWMALTGVIGNFGVAALCWGIATAIGGGVWSTLLIGGAVFNVSAGALNILPVLPMDGGILIAAILSGRRKLAVGWKRVRSLNIILFLGLAATALVGLDLMMVMYAALVLLHMWHAGVEPPEDF